MLKNILALGLLLASLAFNSTVLADTNTSGAKLSSNWAGYVAQGHTYSAVGGSWVVPAPQDALSARLSTDATWVGIGGVKSHDLIQAGTQALIQNGSVQYEAWYETLPDFQQQIPLTIHGGDSVTVSLTETESGVWHLAFINNTTGAQYQKDIEYDSSKSSAEWIEEMPVAALGRGLTYLPLDNFGSVSFSGGYAIADGQRQSIAGAGAQALSMSAGRGQGLLASSSVLADDSFSISREATASQQVSPLAFGSAGTTIVSRGRSSRGRGIVFVIYR